jgi:16S rRNA processing protein RimM
LEPQRSETEDEWVTVAALGRVWGRRGELAAESLTSGPERFNGVKQVYLFGPGGAGGRPRAVELESVWEHRGLLVFKFRGVDSISDAEPLQGAEVRLPRSERAPLADGEFYQSDLIGCEVVERSTGERLGSVVDWVEHGGPPLIEVRGPDKPFLVPFVKSICVEIDLPGRRIAVELPEGLKDL